MSRDPRESLEAFVRECWPSHRANLPHLRIIANHLEALTRRMRPRLLINVSPWHYQHYRRPAREAWTRYKAALVLLGYPPQPREIFDPKHPDVRAPRVTTADLASSLEKHLGERAKATREVYGLPVITSEYATAGTASVLSKEGRYLVVRDLFREGKVCIPADPAPGWAKAWLEEVTARPPGS